MCTGQVETCVTVICALTGWEKTISRAAWQMAAVPPEQAAALHLPPLPPQVLWPFAPPLLSSNFLSVLLHFSFPEWWPEMSSYCLTLEMC